MSPMRYLVSKCYDSIERVFVFINYECLEFALPVWVQSTDYIDQALGLQIGKLTNISVHVAHDPLIGVNSSVLNQ